ncbi:MAG: BrnT family toxin [Pelotomaculum sp.]|nr:BrnT family toxin [Pelotomaculum sp.]
MSVKVSRFEWDARNIGHIARHGVKPDEAEDAFQNNPVFQKGRDGFHIVYGRTEEGRYLFVAYVRKPGGVARVITARNMTPTERRYYRKQRSE